MNNATPNTQTQPVKLAPVKREEMINTIREQAGNITAIAITLKWGKDRKKVYRYLKKHKLNEEVKQAREMLIDRAELNIAKSVQEGNIDDSKFVLQTIGRKRGWGSKVEIEEEGTLRVVHIYKPDVPNV
jgi:hypothetical protein